LDAAYILGGHQDIIREGRTADYVGRKGTITSYTPGQNVEFTLYLDSGPKVYSLNPLEIDCTDEVVFQPNMYKQYDNFVEILFRFNEEKDIPDTVFHIHFKSRLLRSFSKFCESNEFISNLCSEKKENFYKFLKYI